jgi:hypothetical protein
MSKVHVVQRLGWRLGLGIFHREEEDGGVPVRAFRRKKQADALCAALEQQARRELSPFRFLCGELECMTGLTEEQFWQKLAELGIPRPAQPLGNDVADNPAWQAWWDEVAGGLGPEQRQAIWDLLWPRPVFYGIVEGEGIEPGEVED